MRISDWSSDVCSSDLHLSQCEGQLILARVRGELAKNLAGGDDPRCDRRHDAQDVGPVALDERFIDLTSDQRSHIGRRRVGREGIESFLREIADTGGEPVAEQGAGGEHMIGEAARVGKMLANAAARVIRSEEHTSELQSLMRISYAVFCLKKKKLTHYKR